MFLYMKTVVHSRFNDGSKWFFKWHSSTQTMKLYRSFTWKVSLKYDENNEDCLFSTANILDNLSVWIFFTKWSSALCFLSTLSHRLFTSHLTWICFYSKNLTPGQQGWLIVTLNTAAAGGHQCCNRKKQNTVTLSLFPPWFKHLNLLKSHCVISDMAADEIMGTHFLHSGPTCFFFLQMHGFPPTAAYVVKIGRCGNIRRPACQAWVMAICTAS